MTRDFARVVVILGSIAAGAILAFMAAVEILLAAKHRKIDREWDARKDEPT